MLIVNRRQLQSSHTYTDRRAAAYVRSVTVVDCVRAAPTVEVHEALPGSVVGRALYICAGIAFPYSSPASPSRNVAPVWYTGVLSIDQYSFAIGSQGAELSREACAATGAMRAGNSAPSGSRLRSLPRRQHSRQIDLQPVVG